MTTISLNRRPRGPRSSTVALLVVIVLVLGVVVLWREPFANVLWHVLEPALVWRNSLDVGEVSALRAELASTTLLVADRDALYQENLYLKSQMGRVFIPHTLLAGVLMRPPSTPYDTLIIDAGKANGVSVGDSVSAGGTVFIGSVEEVYAKSARVVLYSAGGESHDALLLSKKSSGEAVPIALSGQGAGSFVGEAPAGTGVSVGDMAIFPGLGERLVARVSAIDPPEGASFKKVYLQFPVNIFTLRFVEVHSKNEDEKK